MASTTRYPIKYRFWRRSGAAAVPLALAASFALTAAAPATAAGSRPALAAVSGGVLNAQAVHQGRLTPRGATAPDVTVLPNVKISNNGNQPVNEVPITANPNNALQLESGGNDYNCNSVQGFYNSDDGGATWPHQHCMPVLAGKEGFGDPNVAYGLDGTAYILGIQARGDFSQSVIAFQKSTNNGVSWSPVAAGPVSFYTNGLTDKNWTEVDQSATSPFAGCLYTSITQFDQTFNKETITVDHSCNGGATWSGPKAVSAEANFPVVRQFSDLAVGDDGTVYASWIKCTANGPAGDCGGTTATIEFSKSTNGGNTWSMPSSVATGKMAPDSCFCAFYGNVPTTSERTSMIPVIDVDSSDNLNLVYYNYSTFMQTRSVASTDGGTTWGAPVIVSAASTRDQFLPWLSTDDATGRIGITYLQRTGGNYKTFAAVSTNGGATWKGNKSIASATSQFSNDGFGGGFMGDYTGNIWAGNTLHASWIDTRTGTGQDEWGGVAF
ncbi:MAG TPA: sialidase family protein [Actinomycetota bacterium]